VFAAAWVRITSTVRAARVAGPGMDVVDWIGKLQPALKATAQSATIVPMSLILIPTPCQVTRDDCTAFS